MVCLPSFDSNVIWLGDMNYRIDLENAAVRYLAEADEFDALVAADQVRNEVNVDSCTWLSSSPMILNFAGRS